ncbi:MAG: threonine/serine exporter family protein, partial [Myxococcota bacterium]
PRPALSNVFEPLATFVAMAFAVVVDKLIVPLDVVVVTLAAVIVLLPGLSLTTSIVELATRNLVSGTARLAGAMVVFVGMAVGAALGSTVGDALPTLGTPVAMPIPEVARWAILPLVGVMLGVLLRARLRDMGWCAIAPGLAMAFGGLGNLVLGEVLGAGLAGFGLAVFSNAVSRVRHRPASTVLVPGILLLVPGSAGLRAILALVDHDVVRGVDGLFAAVLIATSLSSGVLLANVALRPRRTL